MDRYGRQSKFFATLFSVTVVLFLVFFLYMFTSERVSVYRSEEARGYHTVTDVQMLMAEAGAYNQRHPELPVHFAVGFAQSSEHPGLSREQLFRQADEDMYRNKQFWYMNGRAEQK